MYQGVTPSVDGSFVKDLKEFDKNLWIEFSRELSRFVIKQPSQKYGEAVAMVIETEEGEFRQPNTLDIAILYWGDLHRRDDPRATAIFGETKALEKMEKDEKNAEDTLREATIDDRYWLRRKLLQASGQVADAPHVRRVEVKSKGYSVIDKRKWKTDHL